MNLPLFSIYLGFLLWIYTFPITNMKCCRVIMRYNLMCLMWLLRAHKWHTLRYRIILSSFFSKLFLHIFCSNEFLANYTLYPFPFWDFGREHPLNSNQSNNFLLLHFIYRILYKERFEQGQTALSQLLMWPLLLAAFLFFLVPAFSIFPGIWGFDDMGRRGANYRKPPHNAITIDLLHFNNSSGAVEIRDWWLKRQTDGRTDILFAFLPYLAAAGATLCYNIESYNKKQNLLQMLFLLFYVWVSPTDPPSPLEGNVPNPSLGLFPKFYCNVFVCSRFAKIF